MTASNTGSITSVTTSSSPSDAIPNTLLSNSFMIVLLAPSFAASWFTSPASVSYSGFPPNSFSLNTSIPPAAIPYKSACVSLAPFCCASSAAEPPAVAPSIARLLVPACATFTAALFAATAARSAIVAVFCAAVCGIPVCLDIPAFGTCPTALVKAVLAPTLKSILPADGICSITHLSAPSRPLVIACMVLCSCFCRISAPSAYPVLLSPV